MKFDLSTWHCHPWAIFVLDPHDITGFDYWYDIFHNICDILQNSHPWSLRLKATLNSIVPLWDLFWMTRVVSQLVLGQNVINFNLLTTKYGVKNSFKSRTHSAATSLKFDRYGGTLRHQLSNSFWTCVIRKTLTISFLDLGSSGSISFHLNQICRTHDFFCRDSVWWANMLQVGRDKRAKLNQVGVLLPPKLGPAMAGQDRQARVSISQWGCSTSCSNLILLPPPSHHGIW